MNQCSTLLALALAADGRVLDVEDAEDDEEDEDDREDD